MSSTISNDGDGLEVLPSKAIESAIVAYAHTSRRNKPTFFNEKRDHIATEELRIETSISLTHAQKLTTAALEVKNLRELQEIRLLDSIQSQNLDLGNLNTTDALYVAQAARDVLLASQQLAIAKVKEAELQLEALKNDLEQSNAVLAEGNRQLDNVSLECYKRRVQVTEPMPFLVDDIVDAFPVWTTLFYEPARLRSDGEDIGCSVSECGVVGEDQVPVITFDEEDEEENEDEHEHEEDEDEDGELGTEESPQYLTCVYPRLLSPYSETVN